MARNVDLKLGCVTVEDHKTARKSKEPKSNDGVPVGGIWAHFMRFSVHSLLRAANIRYGRVRQMKFSVIIPAYNAESTLSGLLDSLSRQGYSGETEGAAFEIGLRCAETGRVFP